jgi:two-component system OmpR family response regulator
MRILLVEDDPSLGDTIRSWLKMDQYAVDWVQRGDSAESALLTHRYDCVLLDRGLPGLGGEVLLSRLRAARNFVPVVIISALDTLAERVTGLDLGADDYLVKPFDLDEMSARIRATIRRSGEQLGNVLCHADLTLDPVGRAATLHGEAVALTAREYSVLYLLLLRKHGIVARAQIEEALYGWNEEIESNAVEVYVCSLRKKLGAEFITTVRGLGYRLKGEHVPAP